MLRACSRMTGGARRGTGTMPAGAADPADPRPAAVRSGGRSWLPSAFVVFSLLMLLAVPLLLERRIGTVRSETLQPAQDARGLINDARQAMSEAEASWRGYRLTGRPELRAAMAEAHAAEAEALNELRLHVQRLDERLLAQVEQLHARSREARLRRLREAPAPDTDPSIAVTLHQALLEESGVVRAEVTRHVGEARARIRRLERMGMIVMSGLGLLTLTAALLVIVTAQRDRRAALLEAELRAAALSLAEATALDDILARIVASAARTVEGASSFVERIGSDVDEVVVVTTAGESVLPQGMRLPYPGSLTETVLRSGEPEQFHVSRMAERPSAAALRASCEECAGVVVPLLSDEGPQGALVLLRPGRRGFRQAEVLQLRIFGVFAALALRRGELLERAVEHQRELERAGIVRERMVRGFSHDLKNPLGAADGHAALLEEGVLGDLGEQQQQHVTRIRASLRGALEIIDDVLELARVEAGQLPIRLQRVDPQALVREIVSEYAPAAGSAGLDLREAIPAELPEFRTDPRRVRQILGNLVSNATKFTPRGGSVQVGAELRNGRPARDPQRWITFTVQDTGPGIPHTELPRLFEEFHRMDRSTPGAGVGLAISQRVAHLLGGEIDVRSEVGRGSTFTLWLPCIPDTGSAAAGRTEDRGEGYATS
jgi:signal transduction histidine kinase